MKKLLLACGVVFGICVSAQVSGTKMIGVDYLTLAEAFTELNASGVGPGGATIKVPAGYAETAPSGGFTLGSMILNASLSSSNPLVIQKSGSGPNPVINAQVGTTAYDAFFKFVGVDYMTIDGFTLQENPSNSTAITAIERGFYFYPLDATDGCNNNTIQNNVVNFINGGAATPTSGVYFAHTTESGTALIPTATSGLNSNNKIYGNTINNALSVGIMLNGYAAAAPYTLRDTGNDVGGTSVATGNTFNNLGALGYVTAYGLFGTYQASSNVSFNTMNFADGGLGAAGIYIYGDNTSFTINNNKVNAPNRLNYTSTSSGTYAGIYCLSTTASTAVNLTANNNEINLGTIANHTGTTYQSVYGILHGYAGTANTGSLTATKNKLNGSSFGTYYGIYTTASGPQTDIIDNTVSGINIAANGYLIYANATALTNILQNKVYNVQATGGASVLYGVYIVGTTVSANTYIVNNLIGDLRVPNSSTTSVGLAGIYLASSGATSNLKVYYNSIYLNGTSLGANFNSTGIYHTFNTTSTTATLDMRNNMVINTSTPKGTGYASAFRRSASTNLNNYAVTSNNNNFFTGSGTNQNIYYNSATAYSTMSAFQTHVGVRETNSQNISADFLSTNGTSTDFLKLNPSSENTELLDNKGTPIAAYTTDYTGATRDAATPDIGAYEFTYVAPTTAPSCTSLTGNLTGLAPNPATISWALANGATGYKVYIGTTDGGTDIVNGTLTTALSTQVNLIGNSTYYVKIVPTNNIGDATGCVYTAITTGSFVYCTAGATSTSFEKISNVTFGTINNNSTSTAGYEDFTAISTNVNRKGTYLLSVKASTYFASDSYFAWIDYNQNGVFEDAERVQLTGASATTPGIATIVIPADAKFGTTRMRIKLVDGTDNTPCQTYTYGQVEDYTVKIVAPDVALITAPANGATGVSTSPATITWGAATGATNYKLFVGTASGNYDVVNGTSTSSTTYDLNLNPSTTYYAKVVSNDGSADSTGNLEISFTTDAALAVNNANKTEISIYPNPFTDILRISDVKNVKSISVSDVSGRQVKTLAPAAELNLTSLNAGLYLVTLHMNDGSVKTVKAIKK
ncbi:beta strand repeat-containing protein [Chryseobacterium sp. R2A-55]|uniref:beta strand repeat-containing protein n=1 Tax=Chryseobacterium sp. R2A-55 TaxID=2744445 RepID=UPI001F1E22A1|nr:GEVED domain-containing protein [Chryseobacterium sp. R2A-55]